jgi:hypothetical protein
MLLAILVRWHQLAEPGLSRPSEASEIIRRAVLEALTLLMWKVLPLADNIMNSWEIKVDKRVQFKLNF